MKIFRGSGSPFRTVDVNSFVGRAQTKLLASDEESAAVHVYHVRFESGGRTNWHTHSGPQWLLVTEGRIRVQRLDEPAQDLEAGDAAVFGAGEKHWHGAVPGHAGVHLAVNIDAKTEWLEPVSDAEYSGLHDQ
jgi:quercetin dioxygenase-like cupin family protein